MKNQALFSLKDKSQKLKCHLLQFLFGALRVNVYRDTAMFFLPCFSKTNFMTSCLPHPFQNEVYS